MLVTSSSVILIPLLSLYLVYISRQKSCSVFSSSVSAAAGGITFRRKVSTIYILTVLLFRTFLSCLQAFLSYVFVNIIDGCKDEIPIKQKSGDKFLNGEITHFTDLFQ